jgi:hypothetical protein
VINKLYFVWRNIMKKVMKFRYRILALLVLAVVLSAATYGFAAANTVDETYAGEGSDDISGYAVSNVTYNLDPTNPNSFTNVSFDMLNENGGAVSASAEVYAGIGDGTGPSGVEWVTCSAGTGGYDFDCDLSTVGISVTNALDFHVAAAD